MTAEIIDGKAISKAVMEDLKPRIASLKEKGIIPGLTVIIVGTDPASMSYVKSKGKACEMLGRRKSAVPAFQRFVDLAPDAGLDNLVPDAEARLDELGDSR